MPMDSSPEKMLEWLAARPAINNLRAGVCDFNGIMRGKLIPVKQAEKALSGGLRIPLSTTSVDIWGNDIANSSLVNETGDGDGILHWTGRNILAMDWLGHPTGLIPLWLADENGAPFLTDPRRALADVLEKFTALGLRPVVATELEFYLLDAKEDRPKPPKSPATGKPLESNAVLSIDELDHFDGFFNDVYALCAQQGVPADTAIAEGGAGQFEINLLHCDDALRAADDALFFKRIVKGVARKHGLLASFMAKPYAERPGNGLHIHFSLLDQQGKNVFDDGSNQGSKIMQYAVAGMMDALPESALFFAPHLNSYRRLQPHTHAPSVVCWGYENRHAAIRIPGGPCVARRIEHRVSGADSNPYLVLAAILGAALYGIERAHLPIDPVEGDEWPDTLQRLSDNWRSSIDCFENGKILPSFLSPMLCSLYAACKRQEEKAFAARVTDFEFSTYLETT